MIKVAFILIPFASRNIAYNDGGRIGYTDYFLFGVRVARIQRTVPW